MGSGPDLRKISTIPISRCKGEQPFPRFPSGCVHGEAKRDGTNGSVSGATSISPGWDDPAPRNNPGKRKRFCQGPVKEDFVIARRGIPKGKGKLQGQHLNGLGGTACLRRIPALINLTQEEKMERHQGALPAGGKEEQICSVFTSLQTIPSVDHLHGNQRSTALEDAGECVRASSTLEFTGGENTITILLPLRLAKNLKHI